jgi:hypothetical protein
MKRLTFAILVLMVAAVPAASSALLARQAAQVPNIPGQPTLARMLVINSGSGEAIPVVIQAGSELTPVTILGTPSVTIAADTVVGARNVRQAWEYRVVPVRPAEDPAAALNAAGVDGWEAVGMLAGTGGASQVLLKRPR